MPALLDDIFGSAKDAGKEAVGTFLDSAFSIISGGGRNLETITGTAQESLNVKNQATRESSPSPVAEPIERNSGGVKSLGNDMGQGLSPMAQIGLGVAAVLVIILVVKRL